MSLLFGVVLSTASPLTYQHIPLERWEAAKGDRFIVDTRENIGYIVHEDGSFTHMRVGSGKNEWVRYIGRTYLASTPSSRWTVKSKHIQGDKITFGPSGRFLRLYKNGKDYTAYGIHATANIDDLLAVDDRYKSFGCVLVDDDVMDILYKTYELNDKSLEVVTIHGLESVLMAAKTN
jgi:hypothetical protein